ncbi:EF hand protein (macronuclear) [Tetrahymena thermophila SB210]|uniref:EF hand protein n=1 Tax=Tetrahymena thermophila (strain SB210) TaxID=312017 RepID=Q23A35_TETTS|nr:EF hand protein [Tetrahymena thermophila SB210]EAR93445.2 EF hand protein [Tetrahymena thermophila SB210]|eukprot:XP_001013690.2 EF hand protein [Tetrahymena thermophila SB210]
MKLRIHRRHESGASNADQRIREYNNHKLNASEVISRRQANNSFHGSSYNSVNRDFEKLNQTAFGNEELYKALNKSKPLYESNKKEIKQRTAISLPRTSQLEEKEKRKRAFVGDSLVHLQNPNSIYDPKINTGDLTNMLSSQIYGSNKKEQQDENLSKIQIFQTGSPLKNKILQEVKHEEYKNQNLETQLVELRDNKDCPEGQFNINKINEIKATIQRKYQQRKNFKQIFECWDEEGKGTINKKNIVNMLSRMGIKCNEEEAQILLSTADKDNSNDLNMQEFLDLVFVNNQVKQNDTRNTRSFSQNPKLQNINLYESLSSLNENQHPEISSPELQRKLRKQIQVEDDTRNEKKLNFVLKNKITQLLNNFWINDYKQTGVINQKTFKEIIRRKVDLSENVISDQEIQQIYSKYQNTDKTDAFNYKQFVKDLRQFNYAEKPETEQNTVDVVNESMKQTNVYKNLMQKYKKEENPTEFNLKEVFINDIQNDNPSHIDWMKARADKLSRHIQKFFNNEKEFQQYLKQQIPDNQDKGQIHKSELLKTFKGMFDQTDLKFQKRDYEGIMEMFQYNKHGFTNVDDIPKIIYQENHLQMYSRIAQKIRGPPPMTKKETNATEEMRNGVTTNSLQMNSVVSIQDYDKNNDVYDLNKQSATTGVYQKNQGEQNQQQFQAIQNRSKRGNSVQSYNHKGEGEPKYSNSQIKSVLKKVEDKLFLGDSRAYQVFKTFDLDKDGYVKKDELNEKLSQMSILNPEEQKIFNKYVDPNNQGYLNFSQFNEKINSQMSIQYEKNEIELNPYVQRQVIQNRINMSKTYNNFIDQTRQAFQQQSRARITSLNSNSQSICNYSNNNIIKPTYNSSLYASEQDRFSSNKLDFQQYDKQKKEFYHQNKLQNIRINNNIIEQRKQNKINQEESRLNSTIQTRAATKLIYENVVKSNILAAAI